MNSKSLMSSGVQVTKDQKHATVAMRWLSHTVVMSGCLRALDHYGFQIRVFATPACLSSLKQQLDPLGIEFEESELTLDHRDDYAAIQKSSANSDFLLFDELNDAPIELAQFPPQCASAIMLHNMRSWYLNRPLRKIQNWKLNRSIKKLLNNFDVHVVPTANQLGWVRENVKTQRHVASFLGAIYEQSHEQDLDDRPFTVVVPGMVLPNRRDYQTVFEAFESAFSTQLDNVRLVLLGRIKGDMFPELIRQVTEAREKGVRVETFDEFVPAETFALQMQQADCILAPIRLGDDTGFSAFLRPEIQGLTKITGAALEQVTFAKPVIYPEGYHVEASAAKSTLQYGSIAELSEIFVRLASDDQFRKDLQESAISYASQFTPEKSHVQFGEILKVACPGLIDS